MDGDSLYLYRNLRGCVPAAELSLPRTNGLILFYTNRDDSQHCRLFLYKENHSLYEWFKKAYGDK